MRRLWVPDGRGRRRRRLGWWRLTGEAARVSPRSPVPSLAVRDPRRPPPRGKEDTFSDCDDSTTPRGFREMKGNKRGQQRGRRSGPRLLGPGPRQPGCRVTPAPCRPLTADIRPERPRSPPPSARKLPVTKGLERLHAVIGDARTQFPRGRVLRKPACLSATAAGPQASRPGRVLVAEARGHRRCRGRGDASGLLPRVCDTRTERGAGSWDPQVTTRLPPTLARPPGACISAGTAGAVSTHGAREAGGRGETRVAGTSEPRSAARPQGARTEGPAARPAPCICEKEPPGTMAANSSGTRPRRCPGRPPERVGGPG